VTKFEQRKVSKNWAYRVLWAYNGGLIEDNYCIWEYLLSFLLSFLSFDQILFMEYSPESLPVWINRGSEVGD
jgi:hypothetical protein